MSKKGDLIFLTKSHSKLPIWRPGRIKSEQKRWTHIFHKNKVHSRQKDIAQNFLSEDLGGSDLNK